MSANLAAIGEYTYSTKQNRIININIRSGIGAGITYLGRMQKGTHGRFGEIAHTILFPNGVECPCGNRGCLERYASLNVLCNTIKEKKGLETIEINEIAEFWTNQDRLVTNEVLTNLEYLSIGINNLISSFDPDEIIINSPLVNKIPELLSYIKDNLKSHLTKETKLSISCLTDKATVYGGIAVVSSSYLNIPDLKFLNE
ncbi:ROK family protein [Ruoffia tabacinasalis]|uniref:ROK family protein n=1 Tax=Ruoffia tabacinasalis TaxID=87458 RepID=A0ABS0LM37_9LACT|nr:ROK family protein [Ruoffia tabacinasalis]